MSTPSLFSISAARRSFARAFFATAVALVVFATSTFAQPAGTIVGRIFNPATQEYVRNAEIQVAGTNLVTYSGDDGSYSLLNVPPGEVTVTVNYTGYEPAAARLNVSPGHTAATATTSSTLRFAAPGRPPVSIPKAPPKRSGNMSASCSISAAAIASTAPTN